MPRYIDADALIKKIFPYNVVDKKLYCINAQAVYDAISKAPTANVVPINDELKDELAVTYNRLEDAMLELVREIFREIEDAYFYWGSIYNGWVELGKNIAELKKKYTEKP